MELTIPVVKIAVVGIVTFGAAVVLKPFALVLRDFLLWEGISWYLRRTKFHFRARRMAIHKADYNSRLLDGNLSAHFGKGEKYFVGDDEVTREQFKEEQESRDRLSEKIFQLSQRIEQEISVIGSLFRHFDQQDTNPALKIAKHEEDRAFQERDLPNE